MIHQSLKRLSTAYLAVMLGLAAWADGSVNSARAQASIPEQVAADCGADIKEFWDDFKAVLKGDFYRVIIPQDNLIDVVHRELKYFFPGHPMFTNFNDILL